MKKDGTALKGRVKGRRRNASTQSFYPIFRNIMGDLEEIRPVCKGWIRGRGGGYALSVSKKKGEGAPCGQGGNKSQSGTTRLSNLWRRDRRGCHFRAGPGEVSSREGER